MSFPNCFGDQCEDGFEPELKPVCKTCGGSGYIRSNKLGPADICPDCKLKPEREFIELVRSKAKGIYYQAVVDDVIKLLGLLDRQAEQIKEYDEIIQTHIDQEVDMKKTIGSQAEQITQQQAEIERLRVQLAGCGVAAGQNTEEIIKQRITKGSYGYSASYDDICRAIDCEIAMRKQNADQKKLIEQLAKYVRETKPYDVLLNREWRDGLLAAAEKLMKENGK